MDNFIENIIREAGHKLKYGYYNSQRFTEKEKGHLFSEYDTIINDYLFEKSAHHYPNDNTFSEENVYNIFSKNSKTKWIIDPIDGTAYFIFGIPFFSISVAKEEAIGIVEAHVFNPVSDEYYYSNKSIGKSYLNGNEIHVSKVSSITESLFEGQAAASLILLNVGGYMLNYDKSEYNPHSKGGIFTNGKTDLLEIEKK